MTAIFKREFKAYFSTPIGYIVLAAFYFFLGVYFSIIFGYGAPQVPFVIVSMSSITVFTIPVLTMRLMSEDRRQKVDQALLTAPVSLTGIVMGKFLAALAVVALGFVPTVIFEIIVASLITVNIVSYIYALIGILLLSGALISIGMFISSLTESPVVAAIITIIVNFIVLFMSSLTSLINVEWIKAFLNNFDFITAFESFGQNIFAIKDIVYFASITAFFIFLSVCSLEKRRWS